MVLSYIHIGHVMYIFHRVLACHVIRALPFMSAMSDVCSSAHVFPCLHVHSFVTFHAVM